MPQRSRDGSRITMRVDSRRKAVIERAAKARGLSVTDFTLIRPRRE